MRRDGRNQKCPKLELPRRKCFITTCLDSRNIPTDPTLVLQVGELRSTVVGGRAAKSSGVPQAAAEKQIVRGKHSASHAKER